MINKLLSGYFSILKGEKKAKFLRADIDSLIKETEKMMRSCELCERRCGVNRIKGERGYCGVELKHPREMLVSSEFLHYGEEYFFVPSHTIFFMGCNFRCVYCQNWPISQWYESYERITPNAMAKLIARRHREGAKNVNFVGGEPTPYLLGILETLEELKKMGVNTPVIWNSNFYLTEKTMKILNEVIDVFLPDFKYGNDECARRLSSVENYFGTVTRNLKMAEGEIVVRHLVLPGHVECCTLPVLEWLAKHVKERVIVNIMDQYTPHYMVLNTAEYSELARGVTREEFDNVVNKARELGLCVIT